MITVSGVKIGHLIDDSGQEIADFYDKVEIIDDEHKHKFIFTQTEDNNGVQVEIIPYDGKLE